jgi:hypothetical protein
MASFKYIHSGTIIPDNSELAINFVTVLLGGILNLGLIINFTEYFGKRKMNISLMELFFGFDTYRMGKNLSNGKFFNAMYPIDPDKSSTDKPKYK